MRDMSRFPPGWRVLAVPSDWDPDDEDLNFPKVTVNGLVRLPVDFYLTIQTAEMAARDEPTAVLVIFKASNTARTLTNITGLGDTWVSYFDEIVAAFPSADWGDYAEDVMSDFLRIMGRERGPAEERRREAADVARRLPLPGAPTASSDRPETGTQRRRKITEEHLREVSEVYAKAEDAPTRAVQHHFNVSHSTAAKWVGKARSAGLLPALD